MSKTSAHKRTDADRQIAVTVMEKNLRGAAEMTAKREEAARLKQWTAARGLRRSAKVRCLHWLARGRCGLSICHENRSLHRWMDHVTGWTKDGKPALLLCQPYQLYEDDLRDLTETAERFGLEITVNGDGWYGYGTIAIELARATKAPTEHRGGDAQNASADADRPP